MNSWKDWLFFQSVTFQEIVSVCHEYGSQDLAMLFGTGLQGWNDLLLTLFHPTSM